MAYEVGKVSKQGQVKMVRMALASPSCARLPHTPHCAAFPPARLQANMTAATIARCARTAARCPPLPETGCTRYQACYTCRHSLQAKRSMLRCGAAAVGHERRRRWRRPQGAAAADGSPTQAAHTLSDGSGWLERLAGGCHRLLWAACQAAEQLASLINELCILKMRQRGQETLDCRCSARPAAAAAAGSAKCFASRGCLPRRCIYHTCIPCYTGLIGHWLQSMCAAWRPAAGCLAQP